jgi:molybdate transport system substrate-binding protein
MRIAHRSLVSLVAVLGLTAAVGACGSDDDSSAASTTVATTVPAATTTAVPTTTQPAVSGNITVFAAASLTDAYKEIGTAFHTANPNANVTFNFAASSTLVANINGGADADVYASADQANMKKLTDAGNNAGAPTVFAHNLLQIIVAPGNPKHITSVNDLANPDIIFVTCDPSVPIGQYTQTVFQKAGITVTPKSLEADVKGIVTKVSKPVNEADAGIVYATDVKAAGANAQGVDIPANINVIAEYPIAVTKASKHADVASAFISFITGTQGQAILAKYGFAAP